METFEIFYRERYIFKIHTFSNSGKTDYGISIILEKYNCLSGSIGRFDKILFQKKGSDLSYSEFKELESFLIEQYNNYIKNAQKEEKNKKDIDSFIEDNEHKIIEIIPFSYTDEYDVFHLNCDDENILSENTTYFINSIEDYNKLSKHSKKHLIYMLLNNLTSLETWGKLEIN